MDLFTCVARARIVCNFAEVNIEINHGGAQGVLEYKMIPIRFMVAEAKRECTGRCARIENDGRMIPGPSLSILNHNLVKCNTGTTGTALLLYAQCIWIMDTCSVWTEVEDKQSVNKRVERFDKRIEAGTFVVLVLFMVVDRHRAAVHSMQCDSTNEQ